MNKNHIYCITIGTGIGGAYYHHELMDGYYQQANSVGYLLYDSVTKTNFEQRAATFALRSMIKQVFGEATTQENIFQRAKSGEQACISMIND